MMTRGLLYVLAVLGIFALPACSLEAQLDDFNSKNQLFLSFDENNKAVTSANYRSYAVKGVCQNVGEDVQIDVEGFGVFTTTCQSDKTFSMNLDLNGISEGEFFISAKQEETEIKKTSQDQKNITVDLTPPTVTVDPPDNKQNYSVSSLRANYPIAGTCSDAFNVVKISTSLSQEYMAVCSASLRWEIKLNLSSETAGSIDFYVQHFDAAGNVSTTATTNIAYPQWQKIGPAISSTGVPSARTITQYGDSGRLLVAVPLRNDDLIDIGIVNFNNTGLSRINPLSGQWALDYTRPIIAVPKHGRAIYARATVGRAQLREIHSIKIDGTDDKVLMGPTPENPVGGVGTFAYALTPNQDLLIAAGDIEGTDNEFNLYAISVLSGVKIKLNGAMVAGGDVREFVITPNGEEVVFRADKDTDEGVNLYAVKVDGTNLRRLGPAMASGKMTYTGFKVSPDSKWVLFRDNQSFLSGTNTGMSVVSLETGEVHSLLGSSTTGFTELGSFSPDSKYVAYRVDRTTATCYALEIFNLQTKVETELSPPCATVSSDVMTYAWSNNSQKLAFGLGSSAAYYDLHVVNIDKTGLLKLTSVATARNGVHGGYKDRALLFTPDDSKIVFQADLSGVARAATGDMKFDLYSTKADGSEAPVKLTNMSNPSVYRDYYGVEISPTGDRVVFIADLEVDGRYEIYLAALDGSVTKKLNPPLLSSQSNVATGSQNYFYDWVRNTAVFLADTITDGVQGIYLSSLSLPTPTLTSITLPTVISGDFVTAQGSANGAKVLVRVNPTNDGEMHLYLGDADGSNLNRVTKNYPAGGGTLRTWLLSDDGTKVFYIADQDNAGVEELYVTDIAVGTPVKLNAAITAVGGNVTKFKYVPSINKVVYQADLTTDSVMDLYAVNLDGTGHTKLTPAYSHTTKFTDWDVAANGDFVAVLWDYRVAEKVELDKIPLAGGAPIALNAAIANSLDLVGFAISPDSNWVCYYGGLTVARRSDVRVVNAATPATNYLVDVGFDTTRMVTDCEFTPDSEYAVIKGDWLTDAKIMIKTFNVATQNLYTLNASLPTNSHTSWSETLIEGGNKRFITLSETVPEVFELYSMNFDGTDNKKISQNPYAGGQVNASNGQAVRIMNDADRTIVYSGLIDTLGQWDLYAVKWDGTQKRKLVTLPAYADIYDFNVVPNSNRVFFRSDLSKDGTLSLYSVALDGTGLKNYMPGLSGSSGVWNNHAVTNTHVIFTSDAYQNQVLDLFIDPI
ncbi:TolB protein [Bdellovibrio sp. 22V]|uniref:TolB protein n=1 Tax=Bdellovibrio sp. 22V TaxID=3044166 RepID=UPI0025432456|nr:TolB protein [Bdellovibrio sp. 22V]WII73094.1 TolB protein [Bdellovibrio sp. 22V]